MNQLRGKLFVHRILRPKNIHEYKITEYSLLAAVSIGLDTQEIISGLNTLCKHHLSQYSLDFITLHTKSYGKISLVLKAGGHYIETSDADTINILKTDHILAEAVGNEVDSLMIDPQTETINSHNPNLTAEEANEVEQILALDLFTIFADLNDNFEENMNDSHMPTLSRKRNIAEILDIPEHVSKQMSININIEEKLEIVRKRCAELNMPLLQEYDFHNDPLLPHFEIDLRAKTKLRAYQQQGI